MSICGEFYKRKCTITFLLRHSLLKKFKEESLLSLPYRLFTQYNSPLWMFSDLDSVLASYGFLHSSLPLESVFLTMKRPMELTNVGMTILDIF